MSDWATTIFCPLLGLVINNIMWLSPVQTVLETRKTKSLGEFNPIPFAFTVLNCIGWIIYGVMLNDQFIFWSNVPGLIIGLWCCINTMAILYGQTKPGEDFNKSYLYMEWALMFACGFWSVISIIAESAFHNDTSAQQTLVGTATMVFTILYYGAPLSSMYTIIKTGDSSSLFAPLIIANMTGSSMWAIYGFALGNLNIYLPNVIGASLSAVQLVLLLLVPRKPAKELSSSLVENDHHKAGSALTTHNSMHIDGEKATPIGDASA